MPIEAQPFETFRVRIDGVDQSPEHISTVEIVQPIDSHHVARVTFQGMDMENFESHERVFDTFKRFVGSSISVVLEISESPESGTGIQEEFHGDITQVSFDSKEDDAATITITAHSPTIRMDGSVRNKLFHDKSASQIIQEVLGAHSITVGTVEATSTNFTYCVQYRETDYQFVCRLAAENGMFAYYDGTTFQVKKAAGNTVEVEFRESLREFNVGVGTAVEKFASETYNRAGKETLSGATSGNLRTALSGLPETAHAASRGMYPESSFVDDLAPNSQAEVDTSLEIAREASAAKMMPCYGRVRLHALQLGEVVDVKGMGQAASGHYWLMKVTHTMQAGGYECEFECVPKEMAYPAVRPRPLFTGLQPAIVTDTADKDDNGKVKVKFPWFDGSSEAETGIWIPVLTPHAGNERGFFCLPEVDDEVMVMFENGNPDKPLVVGSMYNGNDRAPTNHSAGFDGATNDLKVWRTKNDNEIYFKDEDGAESVVISQKDGDNIIKLTMDGPAIVIESANGDVTIKGATIALESTTGDITIKSAGEMQMESTTKAVLKSGTDCEVKGGTNLKAEGAMNAEFKGGIEAKLGGTTAKVEGSAMTEVKGGLVKIN